ncbi:MAG: DUF2207 domain-containing protein [Bacteroidales bacterium]|nr:DUF2207 domain-containing protein [Bacteroidales bacterium]
MKKLFFTLVAALSAISALAHEPRINDISISVILDTLGTAHIEEVWDVVVAKGTEWYLVRENLGDMHIGGLEVSDETGAAYIDEGVWDVERSLSAKAGRCGLHKTSRGYEICWGVGNYGPHTFTVRYYMTNAVKSLNDYDMLHMQFVTPGLSAAPSHVRLLLEAPQKLSPDNSRIWAFGYNGKVVFTDEGLVLAESTEPFVYKSSMILLLRFDKGVFHSQSVVNKDFEDHLQLAMEGSSFNDSDGDGEENPYSNGIAVFFTCLVMYFICRKPLKGLLLDMGLIKYPAKDGLRHIFGMSRLPKKYEWSRDLPFAGGLYETYYVASHTEGYDDRKFSIIPAIMLHMVEEGILTLRQDIGGKKEFVINENAATDGLCGNEKDLLDLLKTAAGKDKVLQEREFKNWASSHCKEVDTWVAAMKDEVRKRLKEGAYVEEGYEYEGQIFSQKGKAAAMHSLQFRQYLKDFTIINERSTPEVVLWGKYLMFAALFGMADKVAREMKNLAPGANIGSRSVPVSDVGDLVVFTDIFRDSARRAYASYNAMNSSSGSFGGGSSGGFGGGSSFGGGGGFSGGGFGGGSR